MRMLVCFRCIQVSTFEEGHVCQPFVDDEYTNETDSVLIIDYEPVKSKHGFINSNKEAYSQMSSGDFNNFSGSLSTSMNININHLSSIKQHNVKNYDLFESSRSKNTNVSHSETSFKMDQMTVNKFEPNDKVMGSLDIKDCLKSEKSLRDFIQLDQLASEIEAPQQDIHFSQLHTQVSDRENSSAHNARSLHKKDSLKSEKSSNVSYQLVSAIEAPQQDINSSQLRTWVSYRENASAHNVRSLHKNDSFKSEKIPRDLRKPNHSVSGIEAPQQDIHSSQLHTQVSGRENASAASINQLSSSTLKKDFRCEKCSLLFRTELLFKLHVQNDCDQQPFKCDQCPKKFHLSDSLVYHRSVYTQEQQFDQKPFKCDQCPNKFYRTDSLANHHLVHTQEPRFHCNSCTYSTIWRKSMRRHMLMHHGIN